MEFDRGFGLIIDIVPVPPSPPGRMVGREKGEGGLSRGHVADEVRRGFGKGGRRLSLPYFSAIINML